MTIKVNVGNQVTGEIESAYCNCKAGKCGFCAHVEALLYTVSKVKNVCTTQGCQWNQ